MRLNLPDLSQAMPVKEGFCHPDWELIGDCIESAIPEKHWDEAWTSAERQWLEKLCLNLEGDYRYVETKNFFILTEASKRIAKDSCKFFEKSLKSILKYLPGVASDEGFGKHIVLMFSNEDDFFRYIMYFYEDGEHPMPGGLCINAGGLIHYVFPVDQDEPSGYRTTLVHELTHGCVNYLPIPAWLNEALAMRMENVICGTQTFEMDKFILQQHRDHWDAKTIQDFWSGKAWQLADQSFELSYALAQIIWRKIEVDMNAPQIMVLKFITLANYADAGESACQEIFDLSLADFVEDFMGEGNWAPLPFEQLFEGAELEDEAEPVKEL